MKGEDRKAAVAAYKERKAAVGIYAVRCAASGQTWVGQSPNLDTVKNRIWFTLRLAGNPHRDLQAAWTAHGPDSFAFEELERMPEDTSALLRDDWLKARAAHWRERLGALPL